MTPNDPFSLHDCLAVVSGASGRLGPAMVRALLDAGAEVVAVARDLERLQAAVGDTPARLETCDVTAEAWPRLVADLSAEHGRLDVLVNSAHTARGGSLRTATAADFTEATNLALVAATAAIQAATPGLAASAQRGGPASVVNVSSMYGVVSPDPAVYDAEESRNPPAYGAAKAGLVQLTRYAAAELGPSGIRVNALVLGPFPGAPAARAEADLHQRLSARTMLGRVGEPPEAASALLFLASRAASYVTGSTLAVDGGWTAW